MRKATALDWTGDPIEVEGRFHLLHSERTYQEMLDHFKDYNDVVGDHPLNMGATSLVLNAYMLTGEATYKAWLVDYANVWVERMEANQGIIPSNIGLDGTLGGACDGKWYGGVYGWGFTVEVPQTGELAHRNLVHWGYRGFGNAILATGDMRYVTMWRRMLDLVNANGKEIEGQTMYPHMYGDEGWYHYTPEPYSQGALQLYYWSMDPVDLKWAPKNDWIAYLNGENASYPQDALRRDFETIRRKVEEGIHKESLTDDTRLSDNPNPYNPATVGTLIQLMLGGLPTDNAAFPLHARLRYFDPARHRPGIPEDVAALIEKLTANSVTLQLVNVNQVESRTVVIQGGGYGEHELVSATLGEQTVPTHDACCTIHLAPGCGARLVLTMNRYANQPTMAFPWD